MPYKLVCFDIDGTLIDNVTSAWQLFHDHFRIDPQKRARARDDFYAGKITYCEWAEHDVALWIAQGATRERMIQAVTSLCVMKGALTAIGRLREKGIMLAVISGSVDLIPHALIPDFSDTFAHYTETILLVMFPRQVNYCTNYKVSSSIMSTFLSLFWGDSPFFQVD